MEESRTRVPRGMPIAVIVCLALGLIANPLVSRMDEQDLARNVIVAALPFILIFAAIILAYMTLIWLAAAKLNQQISFNAYRMIEWLLVAGIIGGVFFMFQPWFFVLFKSGFYLLLASTLGFIAWSHIGPKGAKPDDGSGD